MKIYINGNLSNIIFSPITVNRNQQVVEISVF